MMTMMPVVMTAVSVVVTVTMVAVMMTIVVITMMAYRLSVISVNCSSVAIVMAEDFFGINRTTTGLVTADVYLRSMGMTTV